MAILAKTDPLQLKAIVCDEEVIVRRVKQLAEEITRDYRHKDLVVVGILKGAHIFACDLVRNLSFSAVLEFMSISRYKRAPGFKEVKITKDLDTDLTGRHVLLVEDIVDTGLTLNYLIEVLKARQPASIAVCSLLDRPALRLAEIPMKYVGFNVNEEFLVGYGLDYRDQYRDLPFIAELEISH